jgi:Spy/CpxP family protein refolding chaperone
MKRNWLLYLVIFALALNLGTIGVFAYLRYQDRRATALKEAPGPIGLRELWLRLNLDAQQRQALRKLGPEHHRRVGELRRELMQKRQELLDLLKGENPDWSVIQAKIREISAQQGKLEEEVARFLLECKKNLKPGQQAAFFNLVDRRLRRGGMGHHHRGHRGPMGPHWGPGRGQGMGPPGPRPPGAGPPPPPLPGPPGPE